jgi:hypothetical protein
MLKELFGRSAVTAPERELLETIRTDAIADPAALRERLAGLQHDTDAAERDWDALDRRGDSAAFLRAQGAAERIQRLRAQTAPLTAAITSAERRREAFLSLARLCDALAADVAAKTQVLLEHPPQDARERDRQIRALDQATRVHGRIAGRLSVVSTSRRFKDPHDALRVLRGDLDARIKELDRLRTPGLRPPVAMPAQMAELIDAMEGRTSHRETA